MRMASLIHWFTVDGNAIANVIAVLVTMGIAVLLVCCLECTDCPSRAQDDIFRPHAI
jgi:hypothetical protein